MATGATRQSSPPAICRPDCHDRNFFGRVSYDVTDDIKIFAQASYARSHSSSAVSNQFNLGNITIQPDNAFIPASIAPQVTAAFSLGTLNADLKPLIAITDRQSYRGVIGAEGNFGAAGSQWQLGCLRPEERERHLHGWRGLHHEPVQQ